MHTTIERREIEISSGTARVADASLGPVLVGALIRLMDGAIVFGTGILVHLTLVLLDIHSFDDRYVAAAALGAVVTVLTGERFGIYSDDAIHHRRAPLRRLGVTIAVSFAVLLTIAFALKISTDYSRLWLGFWAGTAAAGLAGGRFAAGVQLRRLTKEGLLVVRVVIVGAGEHGQRLAQHLLRHGDARVQVVGFVDDRAARVPSRFLGLSVLGNLEHLIRMIRRGQVDEVYIALPWQAQARLSEMIERLAMTPVHIRLAPDLIGFHMMGASYSTLAGLPILKVFDRPITGWSLIGKRIEDCLVAGLALVFLAPVMIAAAIAVKLDSPGPILFRQRRQGFNDALFEVWKFRTMYVDQSDANCEVQTQKHDPRVTRVGAFLRKSSIDELPQLLNVIRGDMSIVGPRPHAVSTKAEGRLFQDVVHKYAARHRVKPGITGWAQVNGWRGETDTITKIERRVACDLYYIDHWSIGFDLLIIVKTALAVLRRDNAY
jgi:Undecaprenyl-phosphate glucose phosphotransferase